MQPSGLNLELVAQMQRLAPYGLGNPEPLFVAQGLEVQSSRLVGREAPYHLKMVVRADGRTWDGIGFGMGGRLADVTERVDLLYTPELNTWQGHTSIQLRLKDLRPAPPPA